MDWVMTKPQIVRGEAGKVICMEAKRLKPAAMVMSTWGGSLIQRFFLCVWSFLIFTVVMLLIYVVGFLYSVLLEIVSIASTIVDLLLL